MTRLLRCMSCGSTHIDVIKLLNPETTDMNCKADLKCLDCGNTWVGKTTSPHHEEMQEKGWSR